jgi:hypothetical protein
VILAFIERKLNILNFFLSLYASGLDCEQIQLLRFLFGRSFQHAEQEVQLYYFSLLGRKENRTSKRVQHSSKEPRIRHISERVRKASKVVGCVWGMGEISGDGRNKLNGREEY